MGFSAMQKFSDICWDENKWNNYNKAKKSRNHTELLSKHLSLPIKIKSKKKV